MSWLSWLRKQAAAVSTNADDAAQTHTVADPADDQPTAAIGDAPTTVDGLDFYEAIGVHQRWKNRFKAAVTGQSGERLDAEAVGRADACALGVWLGQLPAQAAIPADLLDALRAEHAEFHRLAAQIIRLADSGQTEQALQALRTDAPYNRASHRVTKLLSRLYLELTARQNAPSR
jgi:hypothetical protein